MSSWPLSFFSFFSVFCLLASTGALPLDTLGLERILDITTPSANDTGIPTPITNTSVIVTWTSTSTPIIKITEAAIANGVISPAITTDAGTSSAFPNPRSTSKTRYTNPISHPNSAGAFKWAQSPRYSKILSSEPLESKHAPAGTSRSSANASKMGPRIPRAADGTPTDSVEATPLPADGTPTDSVEATPLPAATFPSSSTAFTSQTEITDLISSAIIANITTSGFPVGGNGPGPSTDTSVPSASSPVDDLKSSFHALTETGVGETSTSTTITSTTELAAPGVSSTIETGVPTDAVSTIETDVYWPAGSTASSASPYNTRSYRTETTKPSRAANTTDSVGLGHDGIPASEPSSSMKSPKSTNGSGAPNQRIVHLGIAGGLFGLSAVLSGGIIYFLFQERKLKSQAEPQLELEAMPERESMIQQLTPPLSQAGTEGTISTVETVLATENQPATLL